MSMQLVRDCQEVTGREYGAGYGFALCYLSDDLRPDFLLAGALACVQWAYTEHGRKREFHKSRDLLAFVKAYAEGNRAESWMIEAAQLLIQSVLAGMGQPYQNRAELALKHCGHPGY